MTTFGDRVAAGSGFQTRTKLKSTNPAEKGAQGRTYTEGVNGVWNRNRYPSDIHFQLRTREGRFRVLTPVREPWPLDHGGTAPCRTSDNTVASRDRHRRLHRRRLLLRPWLARTATLSRRRDTCIVRRRTRQSPTPCSAECTSDAQHPRCSRIRPAANTRPTRCTVVSRTFPWPWVAVRCCATSAVLRFRPVLRPSPTQTTDLNNIGNGTKLMNPIGLSSVYS